jgi:hypothetical protein
MKIATTILLLFASISNAAFQINHEQIGGALLEQCLSNEVNELVYYSGQQCQVHMYDKDAIFPNPGDTPIYYLNLGNCNNQITKIILDNKMYKVDYDVNLFKSFAGSDPEVYIDNFGGNKLTNCYSPIGLPFPEPDYPLILNFTNSYNLMLIKSLVYGTDQYNKPVIIMDSFTGDIVCDNYSKEVILVDVDDLIFKAGFDERGDLIYKNGF